MAEFISSFTTGFGEVVANKVPSLLKGVDIIGVYDGLLHYRYNGNPADINRIFFFNNTFYLLRFFRGKQLSFNYMVSDVKSKKIQYIKNSGTFRIRFSKSNQFTKVDRKVSADAEASVSRNSPLRVDRLNPTTEMWYVIRDEGFGFYGQLISKRTATEKNLNKGELRPEFAYLMCCCAGLKSTSTVIDPFAGFGSIPIQIKKHFPYKLLIANDTAADKMKKLRSVLSSKDSRIEVLGKDALGLSELYNECIDIFITDPPWGYYENIDDIGAFYADMLREFSLMISKSGRIVLLSARKDEFQEAVRTSVFSIESTLHTLVNGKKAAVYILKI